MNNLKSYYELNQTKYLDKYLKYKNKYFKLKTLYAGVLSDTDDADETPVSAAAVSSVSDKTPVLATTASSVSDKTHTSASSEPDKTPASASSEPDKTPASASYVSDVSVPVSLKFGSPHIDIEKKMEEYLRKLAEFRGAQKLNGPHQIDILKINGKYLFIFGEMHITNNYSCCIEEGERKCTKAIDDKYKISKESGLNIDRFFKELFSKAPFCIDFFIETTRFFYKKSNTPENIKLLYEYFGKKQEMHSIVPTFKDYISIVRENNGEYPNTRFHNIEYRRFNNYIYNIHYDTKGDPIETNIFHSPIVFIKANINIHDIVIKYKRFLDICNEKFRNIYTYIVEDNMNSLSSSINNLFNEFPQKRSIFDNYSKDNLINNSPYYKMARQYKSLDNGITKQVINYYLQKIDALTEVFIKEINKIIDDFTKNTGTEEKPSYKLRNVEKILMADVLRGIKPVIADIKKFRVLLKGAYESLIINYGVYIFNTYSIGRILKSIYDKYYNSSLIITYTGSDHSNDFYNLLNQICRVDISSQRIKTFQPDPDNDHKNCINEKWHAILDVLNRIKPSETTCNLKVNE